MESVTGKQAAGTVKPRHCPSSDHPSNLIRGQDRIKNLPVDPLWEGVSERE